jgi:putative Holliday junction resolvase
VQQFLDKLKELLDVPILPWDERFSTAAAEASLLEADMRRKARRKVIDSVAAQIILQHYLDSTSSENTGNG